MSKEINKSVLKKIEEYYNDDKTNFLDAFKDFDQIKKAFEENEKIFKSSTSDEELSSEKLAYSIFIYLKAKEHEDELIKNIKIGNGNLRFLSANDVKDSLSMKFGITPQQIDAIEKNIENGSIKFSNEIISIDEYGLAQSRKNIDISTSENNKEEISDYEKWKREKDINYVIDNATGFIVDSDIFNNLSNKYNDNLYEIDKKIENENRIVKNMSNSELLNAFIAVTGIENKESFNISKGGMNDLEIDEVKERNELNRKAKGNPFTIDSLIKISSIYKEQYDKHYNKSLISRFFGYFTKENKEERSNIEKIEKYLKDNNIEKKDLENLRNNDKVIDTINSIGKNNRLVSDMELSKFFINNLADPNQRLEKKNIEIESLKELNKTKDITEKVDSIENKKIDKEVINKK